MNVLVTGASGFIGGHLIKRLFADGHKGQAVSRQLGVDCTDAGAVNRYCDDRYDVIMHLAADVPKDRGLPNNETLINNVKMTYNIMEVAARLRCQVIYASSTAVYGIPRSLPVVETVELEFASFYALSKRIGELLCLQYAKEYNVPVAVLRISAPYGVGMNPNAVIAKFVRHASAGEDLVVFGTGMRSQDFTYVKDVADAFVDAMEKKAAGVFNIGTGVSTSMRKLAEMVAEVTNCNPNIISSPDIEDLQEKYRMAVSIDKARATFGYEPKHNLREGLADYIKGNYPLACSGKVI